MSSSDQRTRLRLVTVGDFDPQSESAIESDFIGRVLAGRYRLQAHLGGGAMADVFQAVDEELDRAVALKLLTPWITSEDLCARMIQEAPRRT